MLVYIGIGSNLGDKLENCGRAVEAIAADDKNRVVKRSPFYLTEPVGEKEQEWFVNGAIAVETSLAPRQLLDFLLAIERSMGRVRKKRWGPRVIDLDILFYGDEIIMENGLEVPHPHLHERMFVLVPLRDIAPDFVHPRLGKTISQIIAEHKQGERVIPLPEKG